MKPTILKVFSNYPDTIVNNFNHNDTDNHLIRISNMNDNNNLQSINNSEFLSSDNYCDSNDNRFSLDDNIDPQKDFNVLEDFYRFQERRNAFIDSRKSAPHSNVAGNGLQQPHKPQQHQYNQHVYERPNFSYTQLIYMAIESSAMRALTVNDIYTWCELHFPYYAHALHGWKNSLRHNLSINKCFKKITKVGQGGRGSLWIVDPRERQHLVSTMHRSNLGALAPASIIITRPPQQLLLDPIDRLPHHAQFDDSDIVQIDSNEPDDSNLHDNDVSIGEEKPVFSWTDTRLPSADYQSGLSPDNRSFESDTDFNDWNRAMLSLEPIFPVKLHQSSRDSPYPTVTPPPPRTGDHIYSIPDIASVINDPYSVIRHTFQPPVDPASNTVSYCTSSDYNDEEWPRTPSPILASDPHHNHHQPTESPCHYEPRPVAVARTKPAPQPPHPQSGRSSLKRGRPKKEPPFMSSFSSNHSDNMIAKSSMKAPINRFDRINNMFDMNNFINSL